MERLNGELIKLTAANKQFEKSHKDLEAAQKALEKRASGSESALKQAQSKLKSAEDAAAAGQKLLETVRCCPCLYSKGIPHSCSNQLHCHAAIKRYRPTLLRVLSVPGQVCLNVIQAETKAAEAATRLEELLHRTTKAWLPLWLEEHYNKASSQCQHHTLKLPAILSMAYLSCKRAA